MKSCLGSSNVTDITAVYGHYVSAGVVKEVSPITVPFIRVTFKRTEIPKFRLGLIPVVTNVIPVPAVNVNVVKLDAIVVTE